MRWVHVHTHFDVWAANGPAPTFCITSDDDGVAFIEIAKTPELLYRPVSDPSDLWNVFFSAEGSSDGSVAATEIRLRQGRADYTLPDAVWQQMRRVALAGNEGDRRLYYRVKARPRNTTSQAWASHTDTDVQTGQVPFLLVEPISGDLSSDAPVDDAAAIAHVDLFTRLWLAVIQLLGRGDRDYHALQTLLAHPTYRDADAEHRGRVLELFVRSGSHGRRRFEQLLDLRVQTGSNLTTPSLFYRDERNEGTTLDHLLALWDIVLDRRISVALSEVIYEVIQELIDPPGQINQGAAGTCAATSIQCYTVLRNPAEYARWCRYLLDRRQNHQVRLANNEIMRANPEAFDVATWRTMLRRQGRPETTVRREFFGRTYSERAIQAAIMDYANYRHRYDPEQDQYVHWLGQVYGSGLWEFEISRALEGIFNQAWKFDFGGGRLSAPNRARVSRNVMTYLQQGLPVVMTLKWGSAAHAVLGLRVENGRVIFRNPQYRGSYPIGGVSDGSSLTQPNRRIHNLARAEESMSLADLQQDLRGFCHESSNRSDQGFTRAEIPDHLRHTVRPTAR